MKKRFAGLFDRPDGLERGPLATRSLPSYRILLVLVALVAVSLTFATAAYAAVTTYWGTAGMNPGQISSTCCFYSREYNRVYRPLGYNFRLTYSSDGSSYWSWAGPNAWDNPFVDQRNATSAIAVCNNYHHDWVNTVTCQTTVP